MVCVCVESLSSRSHTACDVLCFENNVLMTVYVLKRCKTDVKKYNCFIPHLLYRKYNIPLVSHLSFTCCKRDWYLQSYRRTDEGKALFNDYGIQWSSGGRPTISIPRDLIERVSRRAGRYAEDAVEQEEEHFKPGRTPYKGHTDYSDARLRILYNQYGFRQAEDRLRKTWNSELSVQLKEQLFNKFIGNVGKIIRGEVGISLRTVDDEQNAEILASQKLFLSATLTDGSISKQHLYIRNVFSAASCFKNKLSRSRVAKKLGLRRQSVSKIASATSSSTYVRQITYTAILALNI